MQLVSYRTVLTGALAAAVVFLLQRAKRRRLAAARALASRWTPGVDPDESFVPEGRELLEHAKCLADILILRAHRSPQRVAHWQRDKVGTRWQSITFGQFYAAARSIAQGLVFGVHGGAGSGTTTESAFSLQRGETVAIAGPTRSEWLQIYYGAQLAGGVSVGVYPKQSVETLTYLLNHSEARVFFSADIVDLERAIEAKAAGSLPKLAVLCAWADSDAAGLTDRAREAGLALVSLSSLKSCAPISNEEVSLRRPDSLDDTAALVYTSGTTGFPKGAMISHRNIIASCETSLARASRTPEEAKLGGVSINYLPLAHSLEQIITGAPRLAFGITCVFNTSIAHLQNELAEVHPTMMVGVPRMFEKIHSKIMGMRGGMTGTQRKVFDWAIRVAREVAAFRLSNDAARSRGPLPFVLGLKFRLADRLIFSRIKAAFGGRVTGFGTGAAPISPVILEFFWGIGVPIFEGWGMTEIPSPAIANMHGRTRIGTIGVPQDGVRVKLAEDGEIMVSGDAVFKGYFRNPAATDETFEVDDSGTRWLKTGDIGEIDDDFVKIVDRKKHIIITAGGKNIAPASIEKVIKPESPLIGNMHVHGDTRPYISAIITPAPIETLEFGARAGLVAPEEVRRHILALQANPTSRSEELAATTRKVTTDPAYQQSVLDAVRRGNAKLVHVEKVRRVYILDRDFSIEGGELTPTMKTKRREIEQIYKDEIDRIYSDPEFGLEAEAASKSG